MDSYLFLPLAMESGNLGSLVPWYSDAKTFVNYLGNNLITLSGDKICDPVL